MAVAACAGCAFDERLDDGSDGDVAVAKKTQKACKAKKHDKLKPKERDCYTTTVVGATGGALGGMGGRWKRPRPPIASGRLRPRQIAVDVHLLPAEAGKGVPRPPLRPEDGRHRLRFENGGALDQESSAAQAIRPAATQKSAL